MNGWRRLFQGIVSCGCKFFLICLSPPNLRVNKRRISEIFCSIKASKCRSIPFINAFARAEKLLINIFAGLRSSFPNPDASTSLYLPPSNMGQWSRFVARKEIRVKKIQTNTCFFRQFDLAFSLPIQKKTPHFCGVA